MRVTYDRHVRDYVYDMRLGTQQVRKLMYGARQIWPTDEERVATAALDLRLPDGTLDGAYWQHALTLVGAASSETCHMRVEAGGRLYNLQTTYGTWNLALLNMGVLNFGDKGPLVNALRVGDLVKVRAVIPVHDGVRASAGENAGCESVGYLPWLPGSSLGVLLHKGRKKSSAGVGFSVVGQGSGRVHINGFAQKNGHCRGSYWGEAWARGGGVINGWVHSGNDEYAEGDTGLKVTGSFYNAGSGKLTVRFPAFVREWEFEVTAITVKAIHV